jgi:FkbM family methyltransferase
MKKKPLKKLKHFFKNLFSFIKITIKSGPLKGKKWIATSGIHFIKGNFEPYKTKAFLNLIEPGHVFFDIGAHFGYFSIIAAEKGARQIFAFEPRPINIRFFKEHIKVNNIKNISLLEAAVADYNGKGRFLTHAGSAIGHLDNEGDLEVMVESLDELVEKKALPVPDLIKIDVEGGEVEVLIGGKNIISRYKPKIIVATHGSQLHDKVVAFLKENNYQLEVLNQDSHKGDTEIVALPE